MVDNFELVVYRFSYVHKKYDTFSRYSRISFEHTLYKVDFSLRRTVYLGTGGFTVKLLWKNSVNRTIIKRTVVWRTLFSSPKWTFCLKIISIKWTQVQKQFSCQKTYIFVEKFFTLWSIFWITFLTAFSTHSIVLAGPRNLKFTGISVRNQHHDSHVFQLQYILLYS